MDKSIENQNRILDENKDSNSYFDGDPWKFFFLKLGLFILKVITLWFAQPYCEVVKRRYELSHTVIDGRRLKFIGTAAGIWKINILWNIITFFTVFTLTFLKTMKIKKWVIENTIFEDSEDLSSLDDPDSYFSGDIKTGCKIAFKSFIVSFFTLLIMAPLSIYWLETYMKNNIVISGYKLKVELSYIDFKKQWWKWMIKSILTLGVYLVFLNVKQRRYLNKYTHIDKKIAR